MPTQLTDCDECHHYEYYDINHPWNSNYKKDMDMLNVLFQTKLPEHICIKIIKYSHILKPCNYCKEGSRFNKTKMLCDTHYNTGCYNGKKYRKGGTMCSQCCWWENN